MEAAEPDRQELARGTDAEVQRLRARLAHALLAAQKLEGDERGEAVKRTQALRDELGAWLMLQQVDEQEVRIRRREDARERPVPTGLPTFAASTLTPAPRVFLRRFNQHLDAAGFGNERRGRILVTCIQGGPEEWAARELVGVDWGNVQRRFLERFQSPQHLQLLLRRLATCRQADGESVADFGARLQDLSIELEGAVTNEHVLHAFAAGLGSRVAPMYAAATALAQPVDLTAAITRAKAIDEALPQQRTSVRATERKTRSSTNRFLGTCHYCGKTGHKQRDCRRRAREQSDRAPERARRHGAVPPPSAPAEVPRLEAAGHAARPDRSVRCFACGEAGHYANACPTAVNLLALDPDVDHVGIHSVGICEEAMESSVLRAPVKVGGVRAMALVDSGAERSVISQDLALQVSAHVIPFEGSARGPSGQVIAVEGTTQLEVECGARAHPVVALVVTAARYPFILGMPDFGSFGIVISGLPSRYPDECTTVAAAEDQAWLAWNGDEESEAMLEEPLRQQLLEQVRDALELNIAGPAQFCVWPGSEVSLPTGDASPVFVRQYDIPRTRRQAVDDKVREWSESGIIVPAPPACQWNSSLLAARKKDDNGGWTAVRVCLDTRGLNRVLQGDNYSLPLIRDVFEALQEGVVFSRLDLVHSYHQLRVAPADQHKLSFTWQRRRWMFAGAPFGVKTLPAHFQRVMIEVLAGMEEFVEVFLDDIIVYSRTTKDHAKHVCAVLQRLTEVGLRVKPAKCVIGLRRAVVLGHVISHGQLRPDPAKVRAVTQVERPETGAQMRAYLGLVNYLREFLPHCSMVTAPLEGARNDMRIVWTADMESAFAAVQRCLVKAPLLSAIVDDAALHVATDASQRGVGAVLYQDINGERRFLAFLSRSLTAAQRNYPATKRELLAILFAVKKLRSFLLGRPFVLHTDHRALTFLLTGRESSYLLGHWDATLAEYDFEIVHQPGTSLVLPDALSRIVTERTFVLAPLAVVEAVAGDLASVSFAEYARERAGKTVPDQEERQALVVQAHACGHGGTEAMFQALWSRGVYWPGMRADCAQEAGSCHQCLSHNVARIGFHPLTPITASQPMDHVAIDLLGPLPVSSTGAIFVCVMVDVATGYIVARPMTGKDERVTAEALFTMFCDYGVPRIVQSDRGGEFVNTVMTWMARAGGFEHRLTSAYHPRANGRAENGVRRICDALRKLLMGDTPNWHTRLPAAQLAVNMRMQRARGASAFALMFARRPNDFADFSMTAPAMSVTDVYERVLLMSDVVRPRVEERAKAAAARRAQAFNKRMQMRSFAPGDKVMRWREERTSKLEAKWAGPYTVVRCNQGGAYVLRDQEGVITAEAFPPSKLKPIHATLPLLDRGEVAAVLARRETDSGTEYLVEWADQDEEDEWISVDDFDSLELVMAFNRGAVESLATTDEDYIPAQDVVPCEPARTRSRRVRRSPAWQADMHLYDSLEGSDVEGE